MRDFVNPANAMTSGSLACGFLALILAAQGDFAWAAGLICVAAGFDAVDGIAARRDGCSGNGFGSDLDSLADLVSFGAAPAFMLYLSVLHEIPIAGIAVCLGFLLSGAWRLARYPLVASPRHYVGLPIPPAGIVTAVIAAWQPPAEVALTVALALTVLMISVLPFPTLFPKRRARHAAEQASSK